MRMNIDENDERFAYLVAQELKGAIAARGYTTKKVAERIGTYAPVLSKYFIGERSIPMSTLYKACYIIGVEAGELLDRASERLIKELGERHAVLAVVPEEQNMSEGLRTIDPEALDLAAGGDKKRLEEDVDFLD